MLTGDLPFSGRTAAQLASQHMNDRPRLSTLPPEDRPVIERALAKDPQERFPNCRELVERLSGRPAASAGGGHRGPAAAPLSPSQTGLPRRTLGYTEVIEGENPPSTPSLDQRVSRESLCPTPAGYEGDTFVPQAAPAVRIATLPPIENAHAFAARPRPTVFVGIGGTGAAVLKALRAKVADRFGGPSDAPAFQMLLIDSDSQTLKDAEYSDSYAAFHQSETLPIPLRKPQDYKSGNHQAWLSRRWLYNIPRSLKTEGLRPLGRLAMADHAPLIIERLQQAITAAASADSRAVTADRLGAPLEENPRVVIVASISGGTGGGSALDMAYFARQALADLGIRDATVDGVLAHGAGRNPQMRELALACAFAFLRELNHYQRRGYPGDRSCGLPPFEEPPFNASYLVHLGYDLNDDGLKSAAETVANYLYLDSFTAAGEFFRHCRTPTKEGESGDPTLRSFGVCPLGAASRDHVNSLVDLLCRGVLDRWRGQAEQSRAFRMAGAASAKSEETPEVPADPVAVERAGGLRIDLDEWLCRTQQIVEAILRSEPDAFFNSLLAEFLPPERDNEPPGEITKTAVDALRAVNAILGHREAEDEYHETAEDNVADLLEKRIESLGGRQAAAVQRCIWERLDAPKRMVRSAQFALKQYDEMLRGIDQKARAVRQEMEVELKSLQQQIREFRPIEPRRANRHNPQPGLQPMLRQLLLDYSRRRLLAVCLQGACKLAQIVCRRLALAGDELKDVGRALDKAAGQFSDDYDGGDNSVMASLRSRTPELISLLDDQFRNSFFPSGEGFRAALRKEFSFSERLPDALRDAARRVAAEAIRSVEVTTALFPEGEDALKVHERLAEMVQAAQPRLNQCGGAARLLLVLPEPVEDPRLQSMFATRFGQPPTVAFDGHCDPALCCEMEQIPLAPLAATLIDYRRDFAEAASRLHTRQDVQWTAWPRPADSRPQ
jgi:eukaryotic-like serine/threonine-protein kinase